MRSPAVKFARLYLALIPFIGLLIAFIVGPVSPHLYLPLWLLHTLLMTFLAWFIGARSIKTATGGKKYVLIASLFFILPWIFITVFIGMGPPPDTVAEWLHKAGEQQVRYTILIFCGVLFCVGFALLREQLKLSGEGFYSLLGLVLFLIAVPLFILNMAFWGVYLTEAFKVFSADGSALKPAWYIPVRELFGLISSVEVAFIYLATACFAASLKKLGWLSNVACTLYSIFSVVGAVLALMPAVVPEPLRIGSYAVSIPAVHFIMPYLMGVGLLARNNAYNTVST